MPTAIPEKLAPAVNLVYDLLLRLDRGDRLARHQIREEVRKLGSVQADVLGHVGERFIIEFGRIPNNWPEQVALWQGCMKRVGLEAKGGKVGVTLTEPADAPAAPAAPTLQPGMKYVAVSVVNGPVLGIFETPAAAIRALCRAWSEADVKAACASLFPPPADPVLEVPVGAVTASVEPGPDQQLGTADDTASLHPTAMPEPPPADAPQSEAIPPEPEPPRKVRLQSKPSTKARTSLRKALADPETSTEDLIVLAVRSTLPLPEGKERWSDVEPADLRAEITRALGEE